MKIEPMPGWTNWIGDHDANVPLRHVPEDKEDLLDVVRKAATLGHGLRAAGARHSTTSVARPDHIYVDMREMKGTLDVKWLKASEEGRRRNLVRVKAGTRVKHLNRTLLGDRALPNMGSFDWQTVIGAISTGTHGSGIRTGPMAEFVRSIEMVTATRGPDGPHVQMRRIEPTDGITDPDAFHRDRAEHKTALVQDDDTFYSAVVSFGSMGLVWTLTLEVEEKFWLREKNEAMNWSRLRRQLAPERIRGFDFELPRALAENDHFEFLVNAAEVQDVQKKNEVDDPLCYVIHRNRTNIREKPDDWKDKHEWPPRRRDPGWFRDLVEKVVRPGIDNASGKLLGIVDLGKMVRNNLEKEADKAPFEGDMHASRSFWVFRRERDDTGPEEEPDAPPEAISNEIAVPLERTVEAIDRILALMKRSSAFYPVPFGVRFVGASRHYLAPQYGRPTCMIEVPLLLPNKEKKRDREIAAFKAALEAIEQDLCYGRDHVGGRPHWGQHNVLTRQRILDHRMYERFDAWERTYQALNPLGVFDNAYTRQLGLVRASRDATTDRDEGARRERRVPVEGDDGRGKQASTGGRHVRPK